MRKLLLVMSLLIASIGVAAPSAVADTGPESTGADDFSGTNLTSAMIASGQIAHCIGYVTVRSIARNGHTLSTKANVCGVYYGRNALGEYGWGSVVRFKCYRDNVQFGDSTGGCRWKTSLTMWVNGRAYYSRAFAIPGDLSSAFWSDSGRMYGGVDWFPTTTTMQMCEDDYAWIVRGDPLGNPVVHFMGITGIDYGTHTMGVRCTDRFAAGNTP